MSIKPELIIPKDHISLTAVNDFNEICKPLFENTDIGFFEHGRIYKDNSFTLLSSDAGFHKFALSNSADKIFTWDLLQEFIKHNSNELQKDSNLSHWLVEAITPDGLFKQFIDGFKLTCGITIAEKHDEYCDLYWFDSKKDKNLYNFYLHNFDVLENFIIYFQSQADELIRQSGKEKITPLPYGLEYEREMAQIVKDMGERHEGLNDLRSQLKLKKYPLTYKNITAYLSPKEVLCLYYLAKGYSQKEISNMEDVSTRTTESHVQHIRDKMDGYSTKKVLDIFRSSSLANLDPTVFAN